MVFRATLFLPLDDYVLILISKFGFREFLIPLYFPGGSPIRSRVHLRPPDAFIKATRYLQRIPGEFNFHTLTAVSLPSKLDYTSEYVFQS